ncbi:hypothetical protein SAMN06295879_2498 [Agreia bicolorata]|uniref:Uncharacterized protein n=1 Tax=Agreia bicolorata TaxID=110935 RepID=A0A1T4Y8G8_9MICO|nr:hypothetical protein SAMN06295879_2498 [Agreia bicolorata]
MGGVAAVPAMAGVVVARVVVTGVPRVVHVVVGLVTGVVVVGRVLVARVVVLVMRVFEVLMRVAHTSTIYP